ncbi:MAG: hypothetical protein ACYDAP_03095 [Thermoplasmataceae archaeon]
MSKNNRARKRRIRISTYFVVMFLFFGLILNLIPMFSFYVGSYVHEPMINPTSNNSKLNFYGFYGASPGPNLTGYGYGFEMSILSMGGGNYSLSETIYNVSGRTVGLNIRELPKTPFIGNSVKKIFSSSVDVSYKDSPFLQLVITNRTTPDRDYFNLVITDKTREYNAASYLGYPYYLNTTTNSSNLVNYVRAGNYHVLANFYWNSGFSTFFQTLDPSAKPMVKSASATILIGSGNVKIEQDWAGWISYGFYMTFPVNIGLLTVGGFMSIIRFRRGL